MQHYYYFIQEFKLVEAKELEPLVRGLHEPCLFMLLMASYCLSWSAERPHQGALLKVASDLAWVRSRVYRGYKLTFIIEARRKKQKEKSAQVERGKLSPTPLVAYSGANSSGIAALGLARRSGAQSFSVRS